MDQAQKDKPKESTRGGSALGRKKLGYRTSKSFIRRKIFRRRPYFSTRPRSLGGHR